MLNLSQIESDLVAAIKAKDKLTVDTLRGLKTRIQNEKTSASRSERGEESASAGRKELSEADIIALIRSEVKRRKDAAEAFMQGGRNELKDKELKEAAILEKYLPAQMPEEKLKEIIEEVVAENGFSAKDFGAAMGKLKAKVGSQADGSTLARLLKEKLK